MHPEIEQDKPGDCPKCGMDLEQKVAIDKEESNEEGDDEEENNKEARILARKFWIGLVLTAPIFLLAFAEMIPTLNLRAPVPSELSRDFKNPPYTLPSR
jgi:hypothetical protein